MAEDTLTIPQTPELASSENYDFLRSEGISFIAALSGKIWTDYNIHDPGISSLELLCYAVTDLGYRTSFSMEDLLADEDPSAATVNFFAAKDILPVNPVTENDIRKLVIDVELVKNAWITTAKDFEQPVYIDRGACTLTLNAANAERIVPISGLYNVLLEFEDPPDGKEESELSMDEKQLRKDREDEIIANVRKTLMAHRALCEDVLSVNRVSHYDIAICADIEVEQNVNVAELQARIYQFAIDYFSPTLQFYTLAEMLEKGKTTDEIFEGPLLQHGFIDDDELEKATLRSELYVSDIISAIMDLEGVIAVHEIKLIPYTGDIPGDPLEWKMTLPVSHAAHLSRAKSKLLFFKNDLPYMAHPDEVNRQLRQLQQTSTRVRLKNPDNNLEIAEGTYRNLADYLPVQNEFPLVYGIGPAGLPGNASDKRVAQAKQLKAYLTFFEQLLTNYLAQLANVKKLFSFEASVEQNEDETYSRTGKTYFVQQLKEIGMFNDGDILLEYFMDSDPESRALLGNKLIDSYWKEYLDSPEGIAALAGVDAETDNSVKKTLAQSLISDIGTYYENKVQAITETDAVFADRRNRVLDHLMARFCEELTEYSLLLFAELGKEAGQLKLIADKETLLREYPEISRDRNRAFDYKPSNPFKPERFTADPGTWGTYNTAGLKQRIVRLLGMDEYVRRTLAPKEIQMKSRIDVSDPLDPKKMWWIEIGDARTPDPDDYLLISPENEERSCIEDLLHYMLQHADQSKYYSKSGSGPYQFHLLNDCTPAEIISSSPEYTLEADRDAALAETIRLFREDCDNENFHLVEHILLRPRTNIDKLLPACIRCELAEDETVPALILPEYSFTMYKIGSAEELAEEAEAGGPYEEDDSDDDSGSTSRWRFVLSNNSNGLAYRSEDYSSINACTHGIDATRRYGTYDISYERDKNGEAVLDMSKPISIFSDSFDANIRELLVQGSEIYDDEKEMRTEIDALQNFLKFNGDIIPGEYDTAPFICSGDEDPYSFRISVVLPAWPTRFRSLNFRKYVEKVIRRETPAHIYVRICWIGFEQMQAFETAYEAWVKTMSINSVPNPNVTAAFIDELFNLNNIYPTAMLHDCETVSAEDSQIILGQTTLGSL
ncbi:MAG: hypothetical protein FD123_867 [Bacteroidetes bacterium]|nr:MAG: hypothetical protein FD123_867 [Bacteroidota bacterium]